MSGVLAHRFPAWGQVVALAASAAVGTVVASRYVAARKISAGERLAEALLSTDSLREAAGCLPDQAERALAQCATYFVAAALRGAEGLSIASGQDDPVGSTRSVSHPYTRAAATIVTTGNTPEQVLTYSVSIPDVGEVRGTRRVGALRMSGVSAARPAPDTLQVSLGEGYTAQIESQFELTDYLVTGKTRIFGAATLRDNHGNVGRLNVAFDGVVTGAITRENHIVGRFHGNVAKGVHFKPYQIEGARD